MKIGVFGNYGHSNIGDEAILRGLLTLLKADDVTVFSDCVPTSCVIHGKLCRFVQSRPVVAGRWYLLPLALLHLLRNILSVRTIIIGGGGLFNDINRSSFLQYVFIIFMSKLFFRKIYLIGVSVGPLNKDWMKFTLRCCSFLINKIYVRDENSVKYFYEAEVIPDLAMGGMISKKNYNNHKCFEVVISAMSLDQSQNDLVQKNYREELEALIEHLSENNPKIAIKLLAMDYERDINELKSIQHFCLVNKLECVIIPVTNFNILEEVFNSCDLVVATRLHAAILAQFYLCPFLSIAYQEKVINYMTTHGLASSCASLDENSRFNIQAAYQKVNYDIEEMRNFNLAQRHKLCNIFGEIK